MSGKEVFVFMVIRMKKQVRASERNLAREKEISGI